MSLDFNGTHSERVVGPVGRSEAHDEGDDTHSEDEQSNDVSSVPLGKHRHCCKYCTDRLQLTDSTKTVAVRVVTLVRKWVQHFLRCLSVVGWFPKVHASLVWGGGGSEVEESTVNQGGLFDLFSSLRVKNNRRCF